MTQKKNLVKLTFKQWVICYVGALGLGGLAWYATGNSLIGGGVLIAFTAIYVFYLSGKVKIETAPPDVTKMSRQQRREYERKTNKS